MIAWLRVRSRGGKVLFRMEDLGHPKDKPGAARGTEVCDAILADLV